MPAESRLTRALTELKALSQAYDTLQQTGCSCTCAKCIENASSSKDHKCHCANCVDSDKLAAQ